MTYPILRLAAAGALLALLARVGGATLTELATERLAVFYPREGLLDRIRDRLGLTPPPAPQLTESPAERLKKEIETSDLSPATKDLLLWKLKKEGYVPAKEAFEHALAAPLRL